MLSFFKNKVAPPVDFSGLVCDMHSHLIPGIDDGAPDLQASLQLARALYDLGYRKLITTPHVMWEMYKNDTPTILKGYETLKAALAVELPDLELLVAAEYFMDEHFDAWLREDPKLLTVKDNLVLVEFSFLRQPLELKDILFKLQIMGYQPIIAHPERYMYFRSHREWYDEMKEIGCLFQLNVLSLGGHYGKGTTDLAHYLIKKKYINLIGTDLHHRKHLALIQSLPAEALEFIQKLLDSGQLFNPSL